MGYRPTKFQGSTDDPIQILDWLEGELQEIEAGVFNLDSIRLIVQNRAPTKPRAGDVRLADGTHWDPGSGAGFYGYRGGAWHLLG